MRLAGETVPSVVSLEESAIVTSAVGCVVSTTVNVSLPPLSVVSNPAVGLTVIAGPGGPKHASNANAPIRVAHCPLAKAYSPVNQNVQSSTGSTLIAL